MVFRFFPQLISQTLLLKKAVLANRAPLLLLRFVLTLAALLRSETRALVEALFQSPPRKPHMMA